MTCLYAYLSAAFISVAVLLQGAAAQARKWNNTGVGAIVLEEGWTTPDFLSMRKYIYSDSFTSQRGTRISHTRFLA
jgi:hypothetical protein